MTELQRLIDLSYKTYKARLKATERLLARQRAWNTSLLALSVATTIASIALLSDGEMYGKTGPTVLVCVSALSLVASLAVAGLNYGTRSRDMFMNYRGIQRLSLEAQTLQDNADLDTDAIRKLSSRYQSLLDDSENHTSADYKAAYPDAKVSVWRLRASALLTALPYLALVVPVLVLIPFIIWACTAGR